MHDDRCMQFNSIKMLKDEDFMHSLVQAG